MKYKETYFAVAIVAILAPVLYIAKRWKKKDRDHYDCSDQYHWGIGA